MEKIKGCTYKTTHMSVASYTILLSLFSYESLELFFFLSVFFLLLNVFFIYIHEYANEIICIFIIGPTSYISTFILYHFW